MKKILLIRPKYPYGKSQIWMPMDIYKVAAKLESSGIDTDISDLNLEELPQDINNYDYVGIGVIGPPYIPSTKDLAGTIKKMTQAPIIIGGPVIENLGKEEFKRIYGDAIQIKNDTDIESLMSIKLNPVYETSIKKSIGKIEKNRLKEYLSNEFSIFISQGCKYACDFCAAVRTKPGSKITEKFSSVLSEDLEALCTKTSEYNIGNLDVYLSSLDLFQTPRKFKRVLEDFIQAKKEYGISFRLRGLSRVDSFLNALEKEPGLYGLIPDAGLKIVGFGVDGTTEDVWRSQHKGIKTLSDADRAYEICNTLGITPEALLVMGFHDSKGNPVDNEYSLNKNYEYALDRAERFRVVSRPHVAKDMVPGNNGWHNPIWAAQKEKLLQEPKFFKNLDYVALASELTHPDENFRRVINDTYLGIVGNLYEKGLCVTSPLIPYTGNSSDDRKADTFNMLVPFDR